MFRPIHSSTETCLQYKNNDNGDRLHILKNDLRKTQNIEICIFKSNFSCKIFFLFSAQNIGCTNYTKFYGNSLKKFLEREVTSIHEFLDTKSGLPLIFNINLCSVFFVNHFPSYEDDHRYHCFCIVNTFRSMNGSAETSFYKLILQFLFFICSILSIISLFELFSSAETSCLHHKKIGESFILAYAHSKFLIPM